MFNIWNRQQGRAFAAYTTLRLSWMVVAACAVCAAAVAAALRLKTYNTAIWIRNVNRGRRERRGQNAWWWWWPRLSIWTFTFNHLLDTAAAVWCYISHSVHVIAIARFSIWPSIKYLINCLCAAVSFVEIEINRMLCMNRQAARHGGLLIQLWLILFKDYYWFLLSEYE